MAPCGGGESGRAGSDSVDCPGQLRGGEEGRAKGKAGGGETEAQRGALQFFLLPHLCSPLNTGLIRFTSVAIATAGCGVAAHT